MSHEIKPETLPEYEENAQRAGRVGLEMLRGIFESTYRMGYEAGAKVSAALSAPTDVRDTRSGLEWLDTAAVLRKVRERLLDRSTEIPFGDGSKRRFVALQAVFDTIDELSELEANITDTTKPTKPVDQ